MTEKSVSQRFRELTDGASQYKPVQPSPSRTAQPNGSIFCPVSFAGLDSNECNRYLLKVVRPDEINCF